MRKTLEGQAGQRLHVAPPAHAVETGVSALAGRPAAPADALNQVLIAVAGWEKNSWDCRYSPSEYSLCGGGGGRGPFDGGGWTGPDFAPYPMDLPTRMSCLAAATSTFEIMRDQVCSMVKDKAVCTAQNHQLFDELWKECMAKYPH